jgi:DNA-binding IclR family transcriptional regulator
MISDSNLHQSLAVAGARQQSQSRTDPAIIPDMNANSAALHRKPAGPILVLAVALSSQRLRPKTTQERR